MCGKQVCAITATLHLEEFLVVAYLRMVVYICRGEGYLFVFTGNFRSSLYKTSSGTDSAHVQRNNTRFNRFQKAGNGRRSTSYRRFERERFQR